MIKKLLFAVFITILAACDNPNQLKEASRVFTPSKDLLLADYIAAADSMAVFSCESEPSFASHLKKDFDEFTEAMAFKEKQECRGICWDKQWVSYYVELYRNGTPIDTTRIYATYSRQGYNKNGYNYYFADTSKIEDFFKSRKIPRVPGGCRLTHWPKEDCGIHCRSIEITDMQLKDSTGQSLSDSVYHEFTEKIKKKYLLYYAQFSVQQKIHLDIDYEIEIKVNNQFVSHSSIKSTPKANRIDNRITDDWDYICDYCNKDMRSVKFKMKFRDPLSPKN
ncbi:hypothetical protein [Fibrobacter succinogenes]|uniref:hypothetical protein n=1 Tax=Fibrobacter succinogenes TaxID=833 RepID=UPI001566FB23|nr:hypothetical protein [Fibrobacter succinogenes]